MVPNLGGGGYSFSGANEYYKNDKATEDNPRPQTQERLEWVSTRNLMSDDPDIATKIMIATALNADKLKSEAGVKKTGRKSARHVQTLSLAWHPTEKPDRVEMERAADQVLDLLGLNDHQVVVYAHNDTAHPHVHLMINRVCPNTGRMATMSNALLKLDEWANKYEKKRGAILTPEREAKRQRREAAQKKWTLEQRRAYFQDRRKKDQNTPKPRNHPAAKFNKMKAAQDRAKLAPAQIDALLEVSTPLPVKPLICPLEAKDTFERNKEDAAYRSGPMSQDLAILADPAFQDYHRRIVTGTKIAETVGYIRAEARMKFIPPKDRLQHILNKRLKARPALRELKALLKAFRQELREARDWLAGKIPPLRHMPLSVVDIARLWRTRGPKEVSLENEMRAASPDALRAEIGGDKPAHVIALAVSDLGPDLIAAEIADVRPHWQKQLTEIETAFQDTTAVHKTLEIETLAIEAEQKIEAERRAQQEAEQKNAVPPTSEGPSM